jgi:PEGA domain
MNVQRFTDMRRTLYSLMPLVALLYTTAAWSQTMIEYGGIGANSFTGISKAAGATSNAANVLGKRLGDSMVNATSGGPAPGQQKQSPSPDDLMLSNRRALEQEAGKHGALLHVTSVPQGATLFVDHRMIARAPADLRLPAGKHTLELKSPAYQDWNQEVSVSAGEKLSFEPKLQENKQAQSDKRIVNLSF